MGRIVVMNHVSLDGVMQGPGRADEDTRGGFSHGGWAAVSTTPDDAARQAMGARMAAVGGLAGWLFGRWTYQDLLAAWNARGGPFKDALNATPKYVVSSTLVEPLAWPHSTVLGGDMVQAVRATKARAHGVLAVMGSGVLIRGLMAANLIDEYLLMIHPIVLGEGRRLFPDGLSARLRLVDAEPTPSGLVIAVYEPES